MSKIKEFYHEEISEKQREAFHYLDEQFAEYQASHNECEYVIHVDAPDLKKANQMLLSVVSDLKAGEEKGSAEFPLPNGFHMSYTFFKIKKEDAQFS